MFSSLSLFIGGRFSRAKQRNKMVSFISLSSTIGIAVGVAVIIIGLSAMNGFERELKDRVLSVIAHGEFEGFVARSRNGSRLLSKQRSTLKLKPQHLTLRSLHWLRKANNLKRLKFEG